MNKNDPTNAISLKNISFAYQKAGTDVLKGVDFTLPLGSSLTIFGVNGSGKSTLGKLIAGLLLHFRGQIVVLNQSISEKNYRDVIDKVGIVFQNADSQFIGEDVENDIVFGLENLNVNPDQMFSRLQSIASRLHIGDILHSEPVNLSAGKKQRVTIASVLITNPKVVIFDESTSMLGTKAKKQILTIIDELKKRDDITVIEITHDTERVLTSDYVLLLKDGKNTFFGKANTLLREHADLFSQSANLELPFIYRLSQSLNQAGLIDQLFLDQEQLAKRLWKLAKSS